MTEPIELTLNFTGDFSKETLARRVEDILRKHEMIGSHAWS